jgi:peroxiredoxin family protein
VSDLTAHPVPNDAESLDRWFDERFAQRIEAWQSQATPSISIMVTKGTLDWAYPPFIIGSTASALGWNVTMFFTFYGLALLKKRLELKVSPLGNPAMPMKMPVGPAWLRGVEWNFPNLAMAGIPGFEGLASAMMKKTLTEKGVASIEELRTLCIEADVKLVGCQMTRDLFGWDKGLFIPEVTEWAAHRNGSLTSETNQSGRIDGVSFVVVVVIAIDFSPRAPYVERRAENRGALPDMTRRRTLAERRGHRPTRSLVGRWGHAGSFHPRRYMASANTTTTTTTTTTTSPSDAARLGTIGPRLGELASPYVELQETGRRNGAREVEALRESYPGLPQRLGLVRGLHAFRDHVQARAVQHACQSRQPLRIGAPRDNLLDGTAGDLDRAKRTPGQQRQVRTVHGDIVKHKSNPHGAHAHGDGRQAELIGHSPLGDLEDNLRGKLGQSGLVSRVGQTSATKDLRGHVNADMHLRIGAEPTAQLGGHHVDYPVRQES